MIPDSKGIKGYSDRQNGRNYLQIMDLKRDLYLEYIKTLTTQEQKDTKKQGPNWISVSRYVDVHM